MNRRSGSFIDRPDLLNDDEKSDGLKYEFNEISAERANFFHVVCQDTTVRFVIQRSLNVTRMVLRQ